MVVCFEVILDQKEEGISLTEIMPDGGRDTSIRKPESIFEISKMWEDFRIHHLDSLLKQIGERLFSLINGDRQLLMRALQEAGAHGERLQVLIRSSGLPDMPFELLYSSEFLTLNKIDVIRRVSNWGSEKSPEVEDRPLTVLFMACSPEGLSPVLFYEKEEDAILEATSGLSAETDVEDTGSLDGLSQQLTNNQYDVIHLSGHANITPEGEPFFWMEDEEGSPVKVTPSELWEILERQLSTTWDRPGTRWEIPGRRWSILRKPWLLTARYMGKNILLWPEISTTWDRPGTPWEIPGRRWSILKNPTRYCMKSLDLITHTLSPQRSPYTILKTVCPLVKNNIILSLSIQFESPLRQ